MQGSDSSGRAISSFGVEKFQIAGLSNHSSSIIKKVSENLFKKLICNKISPFFSPHHLRLRDTRDWWSSRVISIEKMDVVRRRCCGRDVVRRTRRARDVTGGETSGRRHCRRDVARRDVARET